MSLSSNVEYLTLKKRGGSHNWGGVSSRELLEEVELQAEGSAAFGESGLLHRNSHGESYALLDLEE
jgi:hypothetical protein